MRGSATLKFRLSVAETCSPSLVSTHRSAFLNADRNVASRSGEKFADLKVALKFCE